MLPALSLPVAWLPQPQMVTPMRGEPGGGPPSSGKLAFIVCTPLLHPFWPLYFPVERSMRENWYLPLFPTGCRPRILPSQSRLTVGNRLVAVSCSATTTRFVSGYVG